MRHYTSKTHGIQTAASDLGRPRPTIRCPAAACWATRSHSTEPNHAVPVELVIASARRRSRRASRRNDRFRSRANARRTIAKATFRTPRITLLGGSAESRRRNGRTESAYANRRSCRPPRAPSFRRGASLGRQSGRSPLVAKPSTECLQPSCKHLGRGEACRDLELALALDGTSGRPRRSRVAALPLEGPRRVCSELAGKPRHSS